MHNISCYHQFAPDKESFPYCTFTINRVTVESGISQWDLEVFVFDNGDESDEIDDLADRIVDIFNEEHNIVGKYSVSSYLNTANTTNLKDDRLHQRRILFTLRVVGK